MMIHVSSVQQLCCDVSLAVGLVPKVGERLCDTFGPILGLGDDSPPISGRSLRFGFRWVFGTLPDDSR